MTTLKAVRGTRDLLPPETALWNRIETTARAVFARYNFGEIRTPIFEDTSLFARGVGEETDIVSKEMFTWEDGERFDEKGLMDAWTKRNQNEILQIVHQNAYFGGFQFNLIVHRSDGSHEIIEFKQKSDSQALQQAEKMINAYAVGSATTANIRWRLVCPAQASETKTISANPPVELEEIEGRFILLSQNLTLRPENTAGVVRAYIEHKLGETGQLQKLFYIGPQFRRERPQRGRYRQFFQIGAEVIGPPSAGSESPLRDAEVLEMLATLLDELGITGWTLELNSVGSSADRERYNQALRAALEPVKARMCVDCQRRAETNPLRVLDCKVCLLYTSRCV